MIVLCSTFYCVFSSIIELKLQVGAKTRSSLARIASALEHPGTGIDRLVNGPIGKIFPILCAYTSSIGQLSIASSSTLGRIFRHP